MMAPLRSTMSGRALAEASATTCLRPGADWGDTPSMTSLPSIVRKTATKAPPINLRREPLLSSRVDMTRPRKRRPRAASVREGGAAGSRAWTLSSGIIGSAP